MAEEIQKIDAILEMIDEDLNITFENLNKKLYDVPKLHAKYLKIYFTYYNLMLKMEKDVNKKYRELYHYYSFDYNKKLESAKEVEFHILSDDSYSNLNYQLKKLKHIVDCLDRTLKKVNSLGFDVKNIIAYLQYMQGV